MRAIEVHPARNREEPLRQRDAVIGLRQRHAHDDVANASERDQLGQQEEQAGRYGSIDGRLYRPVSARRAAAGRRLLAESR